MCVSESAGQSKQRLCCNDLHGWWQQGWRVRLTSYPSINHVGPLLQHVTALLRIFSLVVDTTRRAAVFMGQALLNPIAVKAELVEDGRTGAAQVMHAKAF